MANTTVGGVTLFNGSTTFLIENTARKEAILTPMPLYTLDSDQTEVFDLGGATRIFTLSGIFVGSSQATVATFIGQIEGLVNGAQDTSQSYPLTFNDDLRGQGTKVKIMDVDTTQLAGQPTIATWSIKMIESSSNA